MAQTDLCFTFEVLSSTNKDNNLPIQLDVISFKLEEGLNIPFLLDVALVSFNSDIDFDVVIDQPALFTIYQQGHPVRYVHGLISDFEMGKTGFRRTCYRAIVEPSLARTRLVSDWRIFQQKNSQAILGDIFKANHIQDVEINTQLEHATREYVVQPGVLDFDFIQRLATEEGYVYRIDSSTNEHHLLLTDIIQTLGTISGNQSDQTIIYNPNAGGDRPQPALRSFTYSQRVRTTQQTQRDYTFKNPRYSLQHQAHGQNLPPESTHYERYDYGTQAKYKHDVQGKPFTTTKIQSLRNDAKVAIAIGDNAKLQPGLAFELSGHTKASLNTWWRPVRITHTGTQHTASEEESATAIQSTRYEQTAELVLATDNWKADIPPPHKIEGPLIAHVTAPEGEEIYCDEFGRVKVIFPWDRYGQPNEHSSCWIRVAQNWAGAGWGHMALPRAGQEVIVAFLGADESQPIIIGRTYDATHPPPYQLPEHKTKMTIKSKTHKGIGFNELTFEDEKDQEEIYIHAQRNQRIHVENDNSELIEHDDLLIVRNDQTFNVDRDRTKKIGQDEALIIGRDRKENIGQDVFVTIGRNEDRKILSNKREEITASHFMTIKENETITIEGVQSIEAKTRLQTLTKDYVLQGEDRILIRGPNGKIIFDEAGITIETPLLNIRAAMTTTGPASDQVDAIKAAIEQGTPFVEECPNKK